MKFSAKDSHSFTTMTLWNRGSATAVLLHPQKNQPHQLGRARWTGRTFTQVFQSHATARSKDVSRAHGDLDPAQQLARPLDVSGHWWRVARQRRRLLVPLVQLLNLRQAEQCGMGRC